jgi:DNA-binding MarR family transcriptional regulator
MQEPFATAHRDPQVSRLIHGFAKIGGVIKNRAWREALSDGLTPTQGQILSLLRSRPRTGMRLSGIAAELGVTKATASDAVSVLVHKELVGKARSPEDRRAVAVTLTEPGRQSAWRAMHWWDFLFDAFETLSEGERRTTLRALSKVLYSLEESEHIPGARMCASCMFFRPGASNDPLASHHCAFGDFDFGDDELRLDCTAYARADTAQRQRIQQQFIQPGRQ